MVHGSAINTKLDLDQVVVLDSKISQTVCRPSYYTLEQLMEKVDKLELTIKKIIPFLPEEAQLYLELEEEDKDGK